MKVLVLTSGYPYDGSTEGTFHKTQADALARLGVEVKVIAPVPWVPYGFEYLSSKWGLYKKIPGRYHSADVSVIRPRYLQLPRGRYWARPHSSYSALQNQWRRGGPKSSMRTSPILAGLPLSSSRGPGTCHAC